ncbi:acyltransferase [Bacteroides sp. L10-4]|uniref:acyltransferase family protein n=1 Tax=Bacteroides sp. L10-4 TaxID=2746063 RepID=UPI00159589BE|nr:acyltransferase [Bacteroides sp. L10-4]NVK92706.1 acyltransferase [Bacteroides sp. L10-4]
MENRVKEIDYLKCIFIILMIIFHLVYIGDKYPYAKQIVYTFHMSAFLIISGYLANNRKDARNFLRKFLWIFIPYVCMEAAYTVMSHFLPVRESVAEITPAVLIDKVFLHPMGPYWYLHTLILCSLIYYITFRYVRLSVVSRLVVAGVCLFALSYCGGLMNFSNALYFLIGIIVSQSGLRFTQVFRGTPLAIVPFVILCCFPANLDRGTLAGVAITWLSISLLLAIYNYLSAQVRWLTFFIGRNTLVILLLSPIFTILSKAFLPIFAFDPTGMLFLVTATFFTLNGCIAMAWTMDKLHVSRFFFGKKTILC